MKKLPPSFKQYFWEINFEKLDLEKRRAYVLKRLLEYGNKEAIAWIWKNFEESEMKDTLCKFRGYSQKSANFWALLLDISKEGVLCLRKPSLRGQKKIWPY